MINNAGYGRQETSVERTDIVVFDDFGIQNWNQNVKGTTAIGDCTELEILEASRGTDPPRQLPTRVRSSKTRGPAVKVVDAERLSRIPPLPTAAAATRKNAQLPSFAPLLEELEVAGWSSHRRTLSGNFHDWSLVDGRTLLVMAGQAVAAQADCEIDYIEAALVAQGAWIAIRSHAQHATDAGALLSLAARSLWSITNAKLQTAVAITLVDLDGGHAGVAVAGDCLALRIRAAGTEQIATSQPLLGFDPNFNYVSHTVQLSLRERIVLVADEPLKRPVKLASQIAANFSQLDAESHRRMMAADAISLVRQSYEPQDDKNGRASASIVAVRRR
jgi:Stage II sporulation protein E (SpoIIE)